ncbi:toll/interleukin-1 receptor domain-containing protein [Saccharothrix deserti]|uniref:toll/interleukin-1 receptor domain-containing protein n=1 Tax=Saccharothrix deserti TaxID=2593674 RepID=UPI00131E3EA8|nr:toll/interleukin-1 receptor domain-containing protein [Saccharothrix deserti]
MRTVFVSYRTGDVEFAAGAIATMLKERIGKNEVFYAPQSIELGSPFDADLLAEVRACPVLLAVVGPHWLTATRRSGGRKLDDPDDWVRREIAEGLRCGNRVIIVLLDGAVLPSARELPDEIAELAGRQYRRMSYRSVPQDIERLVVDLLELPEFAHVCLSGSEDLNGWWQRWVKEHPLFPSEVLLAGREAEAAELRSSVEAGSPLLEVCGDSVEEMLVFVNAALLPLTRWDVRIVHEAAAWDRYAASKRSLVLVPAFDEPDLTALGHHRVVLPRAHGGTGLQVPQVGFQEVMAAFESVGCSRDEALRYATRARRGLPVLWRDLSRTGRSPAPESTQVEADRGALAAAVSAGPLRLLKLDGVVTEAGALIDSDPARAAELYGLVADRLLDHGFVVPAASVRRGQAEALRNAGEGDRAATLILELFWQQVDDGVASWKTAVPLDTSLSPDVARAVAVASRGGDVLLGYGAAIDEVASAFDNLVLDDLHRLDAAVFLSEQALAARRQDVVAARLDVLTSMADVTEEQGSRAERLVARLGMCVAESTGEWERLKRRARREFAPWHGPWITARHARRLAIGNDLDLACDAYEEAVSDAVVAGMNDEAAEWLDALRVVRDRLGRLPDEGDQQHFLARHLRSMPALTKLPGSRTIRERAMGRVSDGSPVRALGLLSQWRWQAYVRAGLADEIQATRELGCLLAANKEPRDGLRELVWAGAREAAVAVAGVLPAQPVRWREDVATAGAAQQSAALAAVAASADLLVDEDVPGWVEFALDVVKAPPRCTEADDLVGRACGLIAALAPCLTETQAATALDVAGPIDLEEHGTLLVDIAEKHGPLAERALALLLARLPHGDHYADVALGPKGAPLLRAHADFVASSLAFVDNHHAHLVLALVGRPTDRARAHARALAEQVFARPEPVPGRMSIYRGYQDMPLVAGLLEPELLARLGDTLLRQARDCRDTAGNRRTALEGLALLASQLAVDHRRELFDALRPFARGECDGSAGDEMFTGMKHPLSWYRADLGPSTLSDIAVCACASLAMTDEERAFVREHAVRLLTGHDDVHVPTLVRSLGLSVDDVALLPRSRPEVHALAAWLWADRPDDRELGLRFASSPDRVVRASLAAALGGRPEHRDVREVLTRDPCRSVRRLLALTPQRFDSAPIRGDYAIYCGTGVSQTAPHTKWRLQIGC